VFPDGRIVYAGAHTDLLIYRAATAAVERIPTQGLWLGLVEDVSALTHDREMKLEPGDVALFHTDGVTEARNAEGSMFDLERLSGELQQWSGGSAADTVRKIADRTREWAAATADDISLMAIKRR
jgi:sigma-B regulation protein RsbU (phosphoserine phosphatase)